MPLPNRVDPAGVIRRHPARGLFMGNRGGALHDTDQQIVRRHKTKSWIICLTEFNDRKRELMAPGRYTELFFLDEATALAAGHRPCFECRRKDAQAFAQAMAAATGAPHLKAGQIDEILRAERALPIDHAARALKADEVFHLPNGTFVHDKEHHFLVMNQVLLRWSFEGYRTVERTSVSGAKRFYALTPGSTIATLRQGFEPVVHPSANADVP